MSLPFTLREEVKLVVDDLVNTRRHLHSIAELSYQEKQTSAYIFDRLKKLPELKIQSSLGAKEVGDEGTGIVATLQGHGDGPTIAIRADMDGLPIQETTNLSFTSKNDSVMHACGHDGHMSILICVIEMLCGRVSEINGSLVFIFQPAEEGGAGAKRMIRDGCLKGVDAAYGLHLWNYLKVGTASVKEGALMANSDRFFINVYGSGGHGSTPQGTVDAVVIGSSIVTRLQTIVSRNLDPFHPNVLSVGTFESGFAPNVIADHAKLSGTTRTMCVEDQDTMEAQMNKICKAAEIEYDAKVVLKYERNYPYVNNEKECTSIVKEACKGVVLDENVVQEMTMAAEDFSFYQLQVPACFFFVGSAPCWPTIPHHKSNFTIHEDSLGIGASIFLNLVENLLMK